MDSLVPAPKKFCGAFWAEGVLTMSGELNFCCRNFTDLGNWQRDGLASAWNSPKAREYRRAAANGFFPDKHCENCYNVGAAYPISRPLGSQLSVFLATVERISGKSFPGVGQIASLFNKKEIDDEAVRVIAAAEGDLSSLENEAQKLRDEDFSMAVIKLNKILSVMVSFLRGDERPSVLVPAREINLINYCNARCIHCPGRFVGDSPDGHLKDGLEISPGVFLKQVEESTLDSAFADQEDILDFWCNGTEFLLYREWEKIYLTLSANKIPMSLSTNSIALTERASEILIDGGSLKHFNISIDGATKETIEKIRVNVKYDKLVKNVQYFISLARERKAELNINFTFTIMKSNYREIPDFIDFVSYLCGGGQHLPGAILFTCLIPEAAPRYADFLREEHHSLVDENDLRALLHEAARRCKEKGLRALVTYNHEIDDFLEKNMPFPEAPEVMAAR